MMKYQKKSNFLFYFSLLAAAILFLKNAWISDDAYIVFRGIEQLFAGNGPNWNPHERVQTFTSPLWFWVLACSRIFSSNLYLTTMTTSLILWTGTLIILRKTVKNDYIFAFLILVFAASRGFFDYTSSGLENGLAYFFISLYLYLNEHIFPSQSGQNQQFNQSVVRKLVVLNLLVFGFIILIRHDLVVLLLPMTLYTIWKSFHFFTKSQWIKIILLSLSPFIVWSLFSLIYYGFPFPNTAYAKISTGIDKFIVMKQGVKYFISSLCFDTVTLFVIMAALVICIKKGQKSRFRFWGYGIVLNLIYIIYVGGDFMQGRFLSFAFLISSLILAKRFSTVILPVYRGIIFAGLLLYLALYPHTPLFTPLEYQNYSSHLMVSDERGTYFKRTSLYAYFVRYHYSVVFPPHEWSYQGLAFKMQNKPVRVFGNVGFFGYWAGTEKIIIDPLALADPFLARLPVTGEWRVGHYLRELPAGYQKSVETGNNMISDPSLHIFYDKIKIVTTGTKLLTWQRIKTIFLFNIGVFDKYICS